MIAMKAEPKQKVVRYLRIVRLVPFCPEHEVPMIRYSPGRGGVVRYYRCPVKNCRCTGTGTTRKE